ncbi:MAG: arginine deiminase family protein [Chloroflexota bacterium]|nr:arginine deiminase family protein [Chloroflexota bacterium]
MQQPRARSETGILRKAVVHTPGAELSNVSPRNRNTFGFDDLLYGRLARREHDTLVALLRDVFGVEVLFFRELLEEALARANSMDRLLLIETVAQIEELDARQQERLMGLLGRLGEEGVAPLADRLIHGDVVRPEASVSDFLSAELYHLPPAPNLMLVRDLAATTGDDMFVAWSSERVRRRENLLWRAVLQHSRLRGKVRWFNWMVDDPDAPGRPLYSLDGGNVVQAGENVLIVGQGPRTGPAAVEKLVQWTQEHAPQETHVFLVSLPSPVEHLDTVFTMLSRDECLVFPPSVLGNGPESINVLQLTLRPGGAPKFIRPSGLLGPLGEALGVHLKPVSCGGTSPLEQRREQWWGGASALAVAPGKVITFRSAGRTIEELESRGYACLDGEEVLSGKVGGPDEHEKCVIAIRGSELSRARGGPRSYVLPLVRDPL